MTSSNLDEVNRLLAESDSSSDDGVDLGRMGSTAGNSMARDAYLDGLLAGKKPSQATVSGKASGGEPRPGGANNRNTTPAAITFSKKMNAEDILNAVSSDSDEDDAEVMKLAKEQRKSLQQIASTPLSEAKEERKLIDTTVPSGASALAAQAMGGGGRDIRRPSGDYDFLAKNMKDPAVREKFINKQLLMSSSDEDDDEDEAATDNNSARQRLQSETKKLKAKMAEQARAAAFEKMTPVALVELNERQSQHTPEKMIEAASQLLSFDKEFYNVKKELFNYSHFQAISQSLYEETSHQYYGLVSCIRMFRAKNGDVIFVGNSAGYIRVYDTKTQRQMKPLYDDSLFQNKVLCIDISEDGHYLLAGYKNGTLVLWDSAKYKKAHAMQDIVKGPDSEYAMVKILFITEQNVVTIVTAEESGRVRLVHVTRTFLGNFSHKANSLYESDLKGAASISVQRPASLPSHYSPFCDAACLSAFGATNMVTIVEMRQWPPKPLNIIKRPAVCKEKSVPSLDWGYGLTPQERERTLPLLAIAWDKVIQLLYVNDETKKIESDGYYCSDKEINQIYFMADSVLVILVNQEEIRVLYTEKFKPGDVSQIAAQSQGDAIVSHDFKATVEGTKASELETGHLVRDIKPGVVTYHLERPDGSTFENKVMNFNNTICQYKKNIIFIGASKIYRARLLSWREFIDKLKFTDNHDWLTVLKVALEIYNGEIKGFALLPDAKERRQSFLKDYMKKLILTSIQTVIFKFKTNYDGANSQSDSTHNDSDEAEAAEEKDFSIDKIAIKVSIEFCLQIGEADYLFGEIYRFFVEKDLEDKFISHLCAPIIAGQFRSERVPESILHKLVRMYEDRQEFKVLEKIILNINVESYQKRGIGRTESITAQTAGAAGQAAAASQAKGIRAYLEVVCKSHCMVSALLQLQTSDRSKLVREGCIQILTMLLNNMETQKAIAEQDQLMRGPSSDKVRHVTKQDISMLRSADKNRKYEIEQSSIYIGYKLLWILSLFLKGKKFPSGDLDESQFRAHVLNIVDFVTNDETLALMLDFDAEAFFQTVIYLFSAKPWHYLVNHSHDYTFAFQQQSTDESGAAAQLSNPYSPSKASPNHALGNKILLVFKQAAERTTRKDAQFAGACFLELVLNIVVAQDREQRQQQDGSGAQPAALPTETPQAAGEFHKLEIDYEWVVAAIKSVVAGKHLVQAPLLDTVLGDRAPEEINQQLIIEALRAIQIKPVHIDEIIELVGPQRTMTRVKIQLFESKHDYVEAFMLHLNNETLRRVLFKWLLETLDKLTKTDRQLRHKQAAKRAEKAQPAMDFGSGEISSQRLRAAVLGGSDSEDEQEPGLAGEEIKDGDEYPPLARLKRSVKARILELAQQSSEQTVQLVELYLADGDYQERLILEQFSRFEDAQLNYLVSYIQKNEKTIEHTMREDFSASHQTAARKYEKYLVLFTKLLCKHQRNAVDSWVAKPYFPPDKCLPICKEYGNLRGEAVLTVRDGKPLDAIDVYLRILSGHPVHQMIAQFKLLFKDQPAFLGYSAYTEDDEEQRLEKQMSLMQSMRAPEKQAKRYFVPDSITDFDQVLGQACSICQLDDLDSEQRMNAWFKILRYLQDFMVESYNKVSESLERVKKEHRDLSVAGLKEEDKPLYIKRLKDFITNRINYILSFPGLDIPLKMIVEQLNLTFEQIQQLCACKLRHNGTTLRIEQCQQAIGVRQLFELFQDSLEKMSAGYMIEPNKRVANDPRPERRGRRVIKAHTICNSCMSSIVRSNKMAEPIVVYQCTHQYHSSCLTEKQRELGYKKCPICLKQSYMPIREEREKLEQRQRKRTGRRPSSVRQAAAQHEAGASGDESDSGSGASTGVSSQEAAARAARTFAETPSEEAQGKNTVSLLVRKMEQYDQLLGDISLQLNSFEEAMEK